MEHGQSLQSYRLSPTLREALLASMSTVPRDQQAPLTAEADLLIGYIAQSFTENVISQLESSANLSLGMTRNYTFMNGRTVGDILDRVLWQMRQQIPATLVGVKRTIIVDISRFKGK